MKKKKKKKKTVNEPSGDEDTGGNACNRLRVGWRDDTYCCNGSIGLEEAKATTRGALSVRVVVVGTLSLSISAQGGGCSEGIY